MPATSGTPGCLEHAWPSLLTAPSASEARKSCEWLVEKAEQLKQAGNSGLADTVRQPALCEHCGLQDYGGFINAHMFSYLCVQVVSEVLWFCAVAKLWCL